MLSATLRCVSLSTHPLRHSPVAASRLLLRVPDITVQPTDLSEDVPYADLARVLHDVEQEPLRLGKEALVAKLLERAWHSSGEQLWL